jgi:hypothetical protein
MAADQGIGVGNKRGGDDRNLVQDVWKPIKKSFRMGRNRSEEQNVVKK